MTEKGVLPPKVNGLTSDLTTLIQSDPTLSDVNTFKAALIIAMFSTSLLAKTNAFREYIKKHGGVKAWASFNSGDEAVKAFVSLIVTGQI